MRYSQVRSNDQLDKNLFPNFPRINLSIALVRRQQELVPVTVHPPGIGLKDDRLAPPRPDIACRLRFLEYVDVMPPASEQTGFQDRRQEPFDRPMIEHLGRLPLFQLQVHLDAVTLVRSDQFARHIEGEPLLVVGLDAIDELVIGDEGAVLLDQGWR